MASNSDVDIVIMLECIKTAKPLYPIIAGLFKRESLIDAM